MLLNVAVAAAVETKATRQLAKVELSLDQTLERQRPLGYLCVPELFDEDPAPLGFCNCKVTER